MRKMMSSDTITWLWSCIWARASRTSASLKCCSRPLLMSSISVFIFTDWAWADWKTANSDDLNSFSLAEEEERFVCLAFRRICKIHKIQHNHTHLSSESVAPSACDVASIASSPSLRDLAGFDVPDWTKTKVKTYLKLARKTRFWSNHLEPDWFPVRDWKTQLYATPWWSPCFITLTISVIWLQPLCKTMVFQDFAQLFLIILLLI